MKKHALLALSAILLSLLALSGCVSKQSQGLSEFLSRIFPGETFSIGPGASVSFGNSGNNFALVGVYSSLCPPKAQCFWEGDVRAQASITGPDGKICRI